ncbi:hypothetical protein G6011_01216 [Alternaria panax]|uniref:Uncharacterized protein n=1 Tax=Alternaria panax TaxID=48097 RepID=A0AAD4IK36_9PLEO|nr:hypothetical protein G6011_01216 [Alternaria panax]
MFLTSVLFLLLSPTLIFAKSVPRADNTKALDQRTVELSYNGFSSRTVTFKDPQEDSLFDYAIVTKYTYYYPDILLHALVFKGYSNNPLDVNELRGWTKVKSVYSTLGLDIHNHRGDIYWKYRDSARIPSSTGQTPSQNSIDRISKILIDNPPAADAFMVCTIILAWTTSLLAYILLMLLLMACIKKSDRNTNGSKETEADEGIELDSMKAPDEDSLAGTTAAATPFEDVKYIYASPQLDRAAPTDTAHTDVLPTYSRQESGCGATFDNVRLG